MTGDALEEAARVAGRACDLARKEILSRFRSVTAEFKSDGSPVTEADRAAERVIRRVLSEAYPDFGLIGEEYGEAEASSADAPSWIIDPIDGTISFVRGIPLFGTLIALVHGGRPLVGVIDLPALDERYVGWKGAGCHRNGVRVHVSQQSDLRSSIVAHGDPICFEWAGQMGVLDRMHHEIPLVRGYTDAFGHSLVLSASLDAMVDCDLNPWDAAATELLVAEAGGACVIRRRSKDQKPKLDLVFGSPALVEQLTDYFSD
jgi:myo-inositol-1(or 4)-monophosphatase